MLPLAAGVIPFGLIYGASAADAGLAPVLGLGMSVIVFAGAAQLATVQLLSTGAGFLVVVATGLVINARHLMYSASIEPHLRQLSAPAKAVAAYLLTDQTYALSIARFSRESAAKLWFHVGAGLTLWLTWQVTTAIGYVGGAALPESLALDFAVPLVFLALLVPTLTDRSSWTAALTAGMLTVSLGALPLNLGLFLGALGGIAAGLVASRLLH